MRVYFVAKLDLFKNKQPAEMRVFLLPNPLKSQIKVR